MSTAMKSNQTSGVPVQAGEWQVSGHRASRVARVTARGPSGGVGLPASQVEIAGAVRSM